MWSSYFVGDEESILGVSTGYDLVNLKAESSINDKDASKHWQDCFSCFTPKSTSQSPLLIAQHSKLSLLEAEW